MSLQRCRPHAAAGYAAFASRRCSCLDGSDGRGAGVAALLLPPGAT
jgi:hypothetical protein